MKTAIRRAKDTVYRYNDAQIRIREATSSEDCSVSHSLLVAITEDCDRYSESYTSMFEMLWKRVNDYEILKHVEKGLIVVEHLLLFGDKQFHADLQKPDHFEVITKLKRYQFIMDDMEIGQKVRDLAANCCKLLDKDEKFWRKERKRAAKHPTFGTKTFHWTSPSSSSEESKKKTKQKKKKKKKKKTSLDESSAKPSTEEFKFQEDPFALAPATVVKPVAVEVKVTSSKKNVAVRRSSTRSDSGFDSLLQDFVSNGQGKAGKVSPKGEETSIFDDFLTGAEHEINYTPPKSGFAGWLGESEQSSVHEDEKGDVWVPGGSNLIDISNPLAKPKQVNNVRKKKGQSMAEMANSNTLANVMRAQPVVKPKQPDPWAMKKPDPFAAFASPSMGQAQVFVPKPQADPFAPTQKVATAFPVAAQPSPFDFQQPFGTQKRVDDPFKNLGW